MSLSNLRDLDFKLNCLAFYQKDSTLAFLYENTVPPGIRYESLVIRKPRGGHVKIRFLDDDEKIPGEMEVRAKCYGYEVTLHCNRDDATDFILKRLKLLE
jgi:hypothetical protein